MRIALAVSDRAGAVFTTVLLQDGHEVHQVVLRAGPLTAWKARRSLAAIKPDKVLTADVALPAPWFLLARFPPNPFGPDPAAPPIIGVAGAANGLPAVAIALTGATWQAAIPDIALLGDAPTEPEFLLADWMAAARAIIAPDNDATRAILAHKETALLHLPHNRDEVVARLVADAELRHRLGTAARVEFERRHTADRATLRALLVG